MHKAHTKCIRGVSLSEKFARSVHHGRHARHTPVLSICFARDSDASIWIFDSRMLLPTAAWLLVLCATALTANLCLVSNAWIE